MPLCTRFSPVSLRRNLSLAGLVVAALSFARFAPAADTSAIDPCRLLTKQETQAALGAAIASEASPPARLNKDNVRICSIRGTNGKGLTVFVGSKDKAGFDREKKGQTAVTGIGDDAYTNPLGLVALRKGEIVITLAPTLNGMPADSVSLEKVKTLARAAAGRI
ncbi:MAG: hypothetical protein M3167_03570 [Acidobacteriota bacterium]|nr:hypothetical protein [Acidobacteriota bacterium]